MFESIGIALLLLLAAGLVYLKARQRLATPGAKRSRRDGGDEGIRSGDAGDGGGDGGD